MIETAEEILTQVKTKKKLEDRKKYYRNYLYNRTPRDLLFLLEEFENQEDYEECMVIKQVIDDHNELCKDNLPTHLTDRDYEDRERIRN